MGEIQTALHREERDTEDEEETDEPRYRGHG
jgi:hypothetical protein